MDANPVKHDRSVPSGFDAEWSSPTDVFEGELQE
jgi:hypothetical protein